MVRSGRGLARGAAALLLAVCRAAAALLALQIALAPAAGTAETAPGSNDARTPPALTIKERLGSKASDDQRVNNCKVAPDLRGPKPRPDDCPDDAGSAPKR